MACLVQCLTHKHENTQKFVSVTSKSGRSQGQANLWSPLAGQSTPVGLVRKPVSKLRWRPTEEDINPDLKALQAHAHTCIHICMYTHTHENMYFSYANHMQIHTCISLDNYVAYGTFLVLP